MVKLVVQWNEVIKANSSMFTFFYEKTSRAQKHSQENINQQNKMKQTLNN